MLVKDSVIWVTGGTSGIGKGCAKYFVEQGAKVAFSGRNAKKGKEIEAELGENALFVQGDVMKHEDNNAVAEAVCQKWGRIDAVCHFAGATAGPYPLIDENGEINDQARDNFRFEIDSLLMPTFDVVQIALYYLKKNEPNDIGERGCIITAGSPASVSTDNYGVYGYKAAKDAVRGLTRCFAMEMAPFGIRINTILPGYIRSGITEPFEGPDFPFDAIPETLFPRYIGEPWHIGKALQFMIEDPLMNKTDISVSSVGIMNELLKSSPDMAFASNLFCYGSAMCVWDWVMGGCKVSPEELARQLTLSIPGIIMPYIVLREAE